MTFHIKSNIITISTFLSPNEAVNSRQRRVRVYKYMIAITRFFALYILSRFAQPLNLAFLSDCAECVWKSKRIFPFRRRLDGVRRRRNPKERHIYRREKRQERYNRRMKFDAFNLTLSSCGGVSRFNSKCFRYKMWHAFLPVLIQTHFSR